MAESCHNQEIKDCPCSVNGAAKSTNADGDLIFQSCGDNILWALNFIQQFVVDSYNSSLGTSGDLSDQHNIEVGKQVGNKLCFCLLGAHCTLTHVRGLAQSSLIAYLQCDQKCQE